MARVFKLGLIDPYIPLEYMLPKVCTPSHRNEKTFCKQTTRNCQNFTVTLYATWSDENYIALPLELDCSVVRCSSYSMKKMEQAVDFGGYVKSTIIFLNLKKQLKCV